MLLFISNQGVFPAQYETVTLWHAPSILLFFGVCVCVNKANNNQLRNFFPKEFHRPSIKSTKYDSF